MFFLNKRSNFEKKSHELSYRSNITIIVIALALFIITITVQ